MILSLTRVACARGGRLLFAGVSLDLAAGDATIVTGPNGIGKSSLLRVAAGLLAPFEGMVMRSVPVALMTDDLALDAERPLGDALTFWARLDHDDIASNPPQPLPFRGGVGVGPKHRRHACEGASPTVPAPKGRGEFIPCDRADGARVRVAAALDRVGLSHIAAVPVRLLSTGQRRRAALARVLASQAPLWLLDEPGNGLDSAGVAMLEQGIARHRAGGGVVMLTTHQPLSVPGARMLALDEWMPA